MANPHKGDVAFDAGGKSYTLRFSVDAICALEEAAGKGIVALSGELGDPTKISMGLLRKIVWAGLREHHAGIDLKTAGELVIAAGGFTAMLQKINAAFELAFPEQGGVSESPPKPSQPDGTGSASIGTGVV